MISLFLEVFTLFPACLATQIPGRANIFGALCPISGACAWHERKAAEHQSRLEEARTGGRPAKLRQSHQPTDPRKLLGTSVFPLQTGAANYGNVPRPQQRNRRNKFQRAPGWKESRDQGANEGPARLVSAAGGQQQPFSLEIRLNGWAHTIKAKEGICLIFANGRH